MTYGPHTKEPIGTTALATKQPQKTGEHSVYLDNGFVLHGPPGCHRNLAFTLTSVPCSEKHLKT